MRRENEYKKLPCTVRISRVTSSREEDFMAIQIDDQASGVRIADVKLSFEQFGVAISGMMAIGEIDVGIDLPLGMTREIKTMKIDIPNGADADAVRKAVAKFEVEGWKGDDRDAFNHHRTIGMTTDSHKVQEVTYHRYVPDKWADERKTDWRHDR